MKHLVAFGNIGYDDDGSAIVECDHADFETAIAEAVRFGAGYRWEWADVRYCYENALPSQVPED